MSSWMRTDVDFGVPWKRFVVPMRSEWGLAFLSRVKTMEAHEKPEIIAQLIFGIVLEARPSLSPQGLIVIGIQEQRHGFGLLFDCVHPSFERQLMGSMPEEERLECCPVCNGPMPLEGPTFMRAEMDGHGYNHVREVCSAECVDKTPKPLLEDERMTDPGETAKRLWPGVKFNKCQMAILKETAPDGPQFVTGPPLTREEIERLVDNYETEQKMPQVEVQPGPYGVKICNSWGGEGHAGAMVSSDDLKKFLNEPVTLEVGLPRVNEQWPAELGGDVVVAKEAMKAEFEKCIANPSACFTPLLNAAILPKSAWIGQWPGDWKEIGKMTNSVVEPAMRHEPAPTLLLAPLSQEEEAELDRQTEMAVVRLQVTAEYAGCYREGLRLAMLEEKRVLIGFATITEGRDEPHPMLRVMKELLLRVLGLRESQYQLGRRGPFTLLVPQAIWDRIDDDFVLCDGQTSQTYRERVLMVDDVDRLALDTDMPVSDVRLEPVLPEAVLAIDSGWIKAAAEFNRRSKGNG